MWTTSINISASPKEVKVKLSNSWFIQVTWLEWQVFIGLICLIIMEMIIDILLFMRLFSRLWIIAASFYGLKLLQEFTLVHNGRSFTDLFKKSLRIISILLLFLCLISLSWIPMLFQFYVKDILIPLTDDLNFNQTIEKTNFLPEVTWNTQENCVGGKNNEIFNIKMSWCLWKDPHKITNKLIQQKLLRLETRSIIKNIYS